MGDRRAEKKVITFHFHNCLYLQSHMYSILEAIPAFVCIYPLDSHQLASLFSYTFVTLLFGLLDFLPIDNATVDLAVGMVYT